MRDSDVRERVGEGEEGGFGGSCVFRIRVGVRGVIELGHGEGAARNPGLLEGYLGGKFGKHDGRRRTDVCVSMMDYCLDGELKGMEERGRQWLCSSGLW